MLLGGGRIIATGLLIGRPKLSLNSAARSLTITLSGTNMNA